MEKLLVFPHEVIFADAELDGESYLAVVLHCPEQQIDIQVLFAQEDVASAPATVRAAIADIRDASEPRKH